MFDKSIDRAKPFERGQERRKATLDIQKDVLKGCEQASRAWLDCVNLEADL